MHEKLSNKLEFAAGGNDTVNISCTCGGDILNECNIRAMGELVNQQEQRPIHN